MRAFRVALASTAAIAATLAIPPSIALAATPAAAPTAPYTAFTIDGAGSSRLMPAGQSFTLDSNNATFTLPLATTTGVAFEAMQPTQSFSAHLAPPTGSTLAVGDYATALTADATHAGFQVGGGPGGSCTTSNGSLNITELVTDDSGTVTALAATYSVNCDDEVAPVTGEIRWHSSKGYTAATSSPTSLSFGTVDLGVASAAQTITVTGTGTDEDTLGAASFIGKNAASFKVSANNCAGKALEYGDTCTVSVVADPQQSGQLQSDLVIADGTMAGQRIIPVSVTGQVGAAGTYYPVTPTRILDTRSGNGVPPGQLGAGATLKLQVENRGGLPATGVSAVVLNVTVTSPTNSSYLTVWPDGATRPTASNINFPAGWTGSNGTTVAIGSGGKVDIYNNYGKVSVIADVVGYYAKDDTVLTSRGMGAQLIPRDPPTREFDSRDPNSGGPLTPQSWYDLWYPSLQGETDIAAFVLNVTAVNPSTNGFLTAWNGLGDPPTGTSTVNFTAHKTVSNTTIVPIGICTADIESDCVGSPMYGIYNSAGTTDVVIDLTGVYLNDQAKGGLRFRPMSPARIVDTRSGLGGHGALASGASASITAPSTVANSLTEMLALNVTAVTPTTDTYLTLWPSDEGRPPTSNINPAAGTIVSNTADTLLGYSQGPNPFQFSMYNHLGTTNVVADVQGAFDVYPYSATDGQLNKAAAQPSKFATATAHAVRH